jgi:hypothetical protein
MKTPNPILITAWALAITLFACSTTTCPAENLYSAAITTKLNWQLSHTQHACHRVNGQRVCDDVDVHTIRSFPANNRTLLNLILGRSPLSEAPTNLTFAVAFGCDNPTNAQWVIFDRSTSNVVAVVADLTDFDLIHASKVVCTGNGPCEAVDTSYQGFIKLSFRTLGSPGTNSIDGGEIRLYAKGSLSREGCITKAISSGSGKIQATADGEEVELFVSNFTLVTGRKMGTLPSTQSSAGWDFTVITPVSPVSIGGFVDTTVSSSSSAVMMSWGGNDAAAASIWTTVDHSTFTRQAEDQSALDPAAVQAALQQAAEAQAERLRPQLPVRP